VTMQRPKHVISSSDVTGNHFLHFFFCIIHFLSLFGISWHEHEQTGGHIKSIPTLQVTTEETPTITKYSIFWIMWVCFPWPHYGLCLGNTWCLFTPSPTLNGFIFIYHKMIHFNTLFSSKSFHYYSLMNYGYFKDGLFTFCK
jgi:hypothetical protein